MASWRSGVTARQQPTDRQRIARPPPRLQPTAWSTTLHLKTHHSHVTAARSNPVATGVLAPETFGETRFGLTSMGMGPTVAVASGPAAAAVALEVVTLTVAVIAAAVAVVAGRPRTQMCYAAHLMVLLVG